jgi:hypothetical protein
MAEKQFGRIASAPIALQEWAADPRVTVRRDGAPKADGACVVYWMQRAQWSFNNAAVDCAVDLANELGLPLLVYFSAISNFPHANLRHYVFLNQGLPDIEADLAERNVRSPHLWEDSLHVGSVNRQKVLLPGLYRDGSRPRRFWQAMVIA